ncbi:hypothetical protein ACFL4L_05200 [bacterium]
MFQKYSIIRVSIILFFITCSILNAQMIGTPIGSKGQGEWSLACTGSFMTQQVGNETATSQRLLMKSTYGVVPWLDFVATIGAANLKLDSPVDNVQDFEGNHKFAFGAGLNFTLKQETESQPLGLYAGAHLLRFPAKGHFQQTVSGEDVIYLYRENRMEYDWREVLVYGGWSYRISNLRLYGCGVGWSLSRIEKKMEYQYETVENKEFIAEVRSEFQSELWTGAMVGIEVAFPKTGYVFNVEGLFFNTQNFILMVGIGQTGIVESGW